jgi:type IV pilus assembly protein PilY1
MKKLLVKVLLVFASLLAGTWAKAADTDLFGLGIGAGGAANVLLIMDNAANFSASVSSQRCSISPPLADGSPGIIKTDGTGAFPTGLDGKAGAVQQCALYGAIASLGASATATLNIGIMAYNDGMKDYNPLTDQFSSNCTGSVGGCLIVPIVPLNTTTKPRLLEYIRKWEVTQNNQYNMKASNSKNGAVLQEAWAYLKGKTGLSGRDYSAVAPADPCGKNTVIFVGNDFRNNASPGDSTGDAGPKNALFGTNSSSGKNANPPATQAEKDSITGLIDTRASPTLTCSTSLTPLETSENKGAFALNWARYMKNQGILVYSIGILGPTCNAEYAAHLQKLGSKDVGGGKYFATTNYEELVAAIKEALSEIQSVNSAFASVSLPLNANVQGQFLNQVFIGMFRPDEKFNPIWPGNLKQYKLGFIGTNRTDLKLLDANTQPAINSETGFISACARSFWTSTPSGTDTYWAMAKSGDCIGYEEADSPDGNVVEKGAQGTILRSASPATRVVKTCSAPGTFASCSLTDFATSTAAITASMLNAATTDERNQLINWARGTNLDNDLSKGTTAMRPFAHGDIVHSRPVAVNYGQDQVVVFYGGNDGMLRAVNGNRTATFNVSAGAELWAFMPPEFFGKIRRLRQNTVPVTFPNSVPGAPKDYGMDGPISAFQGTVSGAQKSYIFATMRRGGRVIYAFDVTTPTSPAVLWKKGCPNLDNDTDCSTGYSGIGQTWGMLKPMFATAYESGATPLLIMAGGYDNCEDFDSGTANNNCTTTKGNKIYVIKAATGEIVKTFDTDRSVTGDPTLVTDSDGKTLYAYAADMGGNVYRLNFTGTSVSSWSNTKIASLGCSTASSCPANRKFAFQPSVVTTDGITFQIMLGSGEREKPVEYYTVAKSVTNYFFMIKDVPVDPVTPAVADMSSLLNVTNIATPTDAQMEGKKGWYLGFAAAGEQVVTSAITIFGVVNFSTHQPAVYGANSCKPNLGETRLYKRDYRTGANLNGTSNAFEDVAGDGLPPSPVGGQVVLDDGTIVPFCIGCSKDSPLEGTLPKPASLVIQPKNRLYWYIQK